MPTFPTPTVTFHAVRDAAVVDAVVEAIGRLGRPGLRALGSSTGHGHVVAIEADNLADSFRGSGIVRLVDPRSRRLDHAQPETALRGTAAALQERVAG